MQLSELIEELKKHDPNKIVEKGFHNPHSYRGYYSELAFEPAANVKVGLMLQLAKDALNQTFEGYKGGDFTMKEHSDVYIANWGDCGEEIGHSLLEYMLADESTEEK